MKLTTFLKGGFASILFCLLTTFPAHGKSLYISVNGNDAVTYDANNAGNPWKSVEKAFFEPKAGDTVLFSRGVYTITTRITQAAKGYHGTAVKPILITHVRGDSVTIVALDSVHPPVDVEKDYYIVDGLHFIGPGCFFRIGWDFTGRAFILRKCTAKMTRGGDNYGFVYVDGATDVKVEDCTIEGVYPAGSDPMNSTAGVIAFNSPGLKVLHCEFHHMKLGMYYKHANMPPVESGIEIAYNYIHHTELSGMELNCNFAKVHDNVLGTATSQFKFNDANGGPGGDFNTIDHNTVYDCPLVLKYDTQTGDPNPGAIGNTVTNNLFLKSTEYHTYSPVPHKTISGNNLYAPGISIEENRIMYTLADFQRYSGQEKNSFVGAPVFQVTAPTSVKQFALKPGSPGYLKGSDGKNIGADIGSVGPNSLAPINLAPNLYHSISK